MLSARISLTSTRRQKVPISRRVQKVQHLREGSLQVTEQENKNVTSASRRYLQEEPTINKELVSRHFLMNVKCLIIY